MRKLYTLLLGFSLTLALSPSIAQTFTNRGTDFWVGYQASDLNSSSANMVIYLTGGSATSIVQIAVNQWIRNYTVPANTTVVTEAIPKTGAQDARLLSWGLYLNKGIHITSDQPITAYAHLFGSASSGATMLLPAHVLGSENHILTFRQVYTSTSYSVFHFIAKEDSTWVEVNPSNPTQNGMVPNGGSQPNGSYLIKLNKGDAYQVLGSIISGSEGYDLTGSTVLSVPNGQGKTHPVAVFAGSTRTSIGCASGSNSSGDLIIQQVFPYHTWGTRYATAPFSNNNAPAANGLMTTIYRVLVKNPTTVVYRNGAPLTSLVAGKYYQFESNTPDVITASEPVMVAQFMPSSGGCANTGTIGDPEMVYLTPMSVAISQTVFYRNNKEAITVNLLTLIIPSAGVSSLTIDGVPFASIASTNAWSYAHPNLPGYTVVNRKWTAAPAQCTVQSNYAFTGITYGLGQVESYGYNIGAQFDSTSLQSVKYNTITGTMFIDKNSNGIKDSTEVFFTNGKVQQIKPGVDTLSVYSSNGRFMMYVDTGTYISRVLSNVQYFQVVPATRTSSFGTYFNTDTVQFALQPIPGIRDLSVQLSALTPARPGLKVTYRLTYKNNGTDVADAQLTLLKSNKLIYDSAYVTPASIVGDTLKWNITTLVPGQSASINVRFIVMSPPAATINDTIRLKATITSAVTDTTPLNNTANLVQRLRGSYDPNDKRENHDGQVLLPAIANGEYLQYTIRFQNTGNDTAFHIVVRDTLDAKLDWNSLVMVGSSHDNQLNINDGRYCSWVFNDIKLPDSNRNEPMSHGFITYMIKPKATIAVGDILNNTAHIYFDHNMAVITNTEATTVVNEALPVKLLHFTASRRQKQNLLQWSTTQEVSFSHFELQRSTNGRLFSKIGTIAAGGGTYEYADDLFEKTYNYYRLKLVDKDGKFTYSPVRILNNKGGLDFTLYPNPVKDMLQLKVESTLPNNIQVEVLSVNGKVMLAQTIRVAAGINTTGIDVNGLPAGNYMLKITSAGKETSVIMFEKQ
jgi:uncharacterized repeat protein (TIGR01451 family)